MPVAATKSSCLGTAKDGGVSRSFTLADTRYCFAHAPARVAEVRAGRAQGGRKAAKLRAFRNRREKLDSAAAPVRGAGEVVLDTLDGALEPEVARAALRGLSLIRRFLEAGE